MNFVKTEIHQNNGKKNTENCTLLYLTVKTNYKYGFKKLLHVV